MWKVVWSRKVDRALARLPWHIQEKFRAWAVAVETEGLAGVRLLKGFHDEPLKGDRKGQRSVRLNIAYRVIYLDPGSTETIEVIEIHKHEY